ncbi:YbaK/EbsC family protein [Tropicimonas isoalkanivorans]|uniref:Cys-tRNA(Pro) deacylase, prolyl-tRNA editing enzyme YbaK/EbsC n=1 Tax=Tropicimonas isoalkanivorans TaxID=441112 RepID=A0A1I1K7Z5_9RHOB|nr:YbaK/EbsC family protein [Tropicimonas isoalkanivorans]SFC56661.1 Cys-tRNA(Pro) deacylase, prolyl-tRNA editing enzyme YbaK/EbsC [Tropicimonas isoalkanivorans]
MSNSLTRVTDALESAGVTYTLREMSESTRTAKDAAEAVGCEIDQIAKSIILETEESEALVLFVTAGGNRVSTEAVAALLGEAAHPARGARIRDVTGFAIGGVAPVGHLTPVRAFFDPRLTDFETVWAAAGTPRHVFGVAPDRLRRACGGELAEFVETDD